MRFVWVLVALAVSGCAATPTPPSPDGKHELVIDPWERVGQKLGK